MLNGILKTCDQNISVRSFNKAECDLQNGNLKYIHSMHYVV